MDSGVLLLTLMHGLAQVCFSKVKRVFAVVTVVQVCLTVVPKAEAVQIAVLETDLPGTLVKNFRHVWEPESSNQAGRGDHQLCDCEVFTVTLKHLAITAAPRVIAIQIFVGAFPNNFALADLSTECWRPLELNTLKFFRNIDQIRTESICYRELVDERVCHIGLILLDVLDQLVET